MKQTYPISLVAELTGLPIHVIRAWERRYGIIVPNRSEGNQRLYTSMEMEKLCLLSEALSVGYKIRHIVSLNHRELLELLGNQDEGDTQSHDLSEHFLEQALRAIKNLDVSELDNILTDSAESMNLTFVIDHVISPLLEKVEEGYKKGEFPKFHEYMAVAVLQNFLGHIFRKIPVSEKAPAAVVASPTGQPNCLGAIIGAIAAVSVGYRVVFLGNRVPTSEMIDTVKITKSPVLLVCINLSGYEGNVRKVLRLLTEKVEKHTRLIVAGVSTFNFLTKEGRSIAGPQRVGHLKNLLTTLKE